MNKLTKLRMNNKRLVRRTLKNARKMIDQHERWCKGAFALTVTTEAGDKTSVPGTSCMPESRFAQSWCALGACKRAVNDIEGLGLSQSSRLITQMVSTLNHHLPKSGGDSFVRFNDRYGTTHKQIMNLFDRAIDSLKEERKKKP